MPDWRDWLTAFVLTQLIEVPILAAWLRGRPWPQRLGLAFGASAITHPILWFVLRPILASGNFVAYVVIGEAFATLFEAWYLKRLGVADPLLASVSSNAASWLTGRVIYASGMLLGSALFVAGCGSTTGGAELADAIAPHEATLSQFERWARRVTSAASPRELPRVSETLFASVRREPLWHVVVVERSGHLPFRAAHPQGAQVPALPWQRVRSRELGLLDAARDPSEPTRVWARWAVRDEPSLTITVELAAP